MGYVAAMSPCIGCHRVFSYNPVRVPSVTINGKREPICADCVVRVNPLRIAAMAAATRSSSVPGFKPISQDYLPGFAETIKALRADEITINDC